MRMAAAGLMKTPKELNTVMNVVACVRNLQGCARTPRMEKMMAPRRWDIYLGINMATSIPDETQFWV